MEENVSIQYEPFKEIVIMQCTKFAAPEELARFTGIIAGGKTAGIYWAEGVAFIYFPLHVDTETAAKALIEQKRVYWTFVSYALMPKYQKRLETKEKLIIPIVDMSSNPLFRKVAQWLKSREQ
ncbi:MAG: hypothetical protein U9O89_05625 [Thermoproteota archaeon]|nr:hypothetical protein [Thermoproteota archaeon]